MIINKIGHQEQEIQARQPRNCGINNMLTQRGLFHRLYGVLKSRVFFHALVVTSSVFTDFKKQNNMLTHWGSKSPANDGARSMTVVSLKKLKFWKLIWADLANLESVVSPKIEQLIGIAVDLNLTIGFLNLSHFNFPMLYSIIPMNKYFNLYLGLK